MKFLVSYLSDVGSTKSVNQDSFGYKEINVNGENYSIFIVCDGMGGLQKGELASATVVNSFLKWFEESFPEICEGFHFPTIQEKMSELIQDANKSLFQYGTKNNMQLGTTLSVVVCSEYGNYLIANVGDSRVYHISQEKTVQLTVDQTFVEQEIRNNRMTREEALTSKYRNVLTQCIGASNSVEPLFYKGMVESGTAFLACSDGFRHFMSESDLDDAFKDCKQSENDADWAAVLKQITENAKSKGEKDNITSAVLKFC